MLAVPDFRSWHCIDPVLVRSSCPPVALIRVYTSFLLAFFRQYRNGAVAVLQVLDHDHLVRVFILHHPEAWPATAWWGYFFSGLEHPGCGLLRLRGHHLAIRESRYGRPAFLIIYCLVQAGVFVVVEPVTLAVEAGFVAGTVHDGAAAHRYLPVRIIFSGLNVIFAAINAGLFEFAQVACRIVGAPLAYHQPVTVASPCLHLFVRAGSLCVEEPTAMVQPVLVELVFEEEINDGQGFELSLSSVGAQQAEAKGQERFEG